MQLPRGIAIDQKTAQRFEAWISVRYWRVTADIAKFIQIRRRERPVGKSYVTFLRSRDTGVEHQNTKGSLGNVRFRTIADIAGFWSGTVCPLMTQSGRNVQIDIRWATNSVSDILEHAAELVALAPDVILAHGSATVRPLAQATRTVPIVFPVAVDPVGAGFVASLARPGGNVTGFMVTDFSVGGKWLELLKQIAPGTTRAGVLRDSTQGSGISQFAAIQAVAPSLGIEVRPMSVGNAGEIEEAIKAFASVSNGGLIVTYGAWAFDHRGLVITLAARHKLPAVYFERLFVTAGGLISYGPNEIDQYRQAASYVDRILKGEKPSELPVQAPTKYETVLNLKTAKALNLALPPAVLARVDAVIE